MDIFTMQASITKVGEQRPWTVKLHCICMDSTDNTCNQEGRALIISLDRRSHGNCFRQRIFW